MDISAMPLNRMTSRPKKVKPAISWPSLGLMGWMWVRRNRVAAISPITKIWKDLALYTTMVRLMRVNSLFIRAFQRWKPAYVIHPLGLVDLDEELSAWAMCCALH